MSGGSPPAAPTLISIVPDLHGGRGHMYSYHVAVGQAVQGQGWRHLVATAPDAELGTLPAGWVGCLKGQALERGYSDLRRTIGRLGIVREIRALAASITAFVRQVLAQQPGPVILFMERFSAHQLAALPLVLLALPRRRVRCWLLFRHEPGSPVAPGLWIHRQFLQLIAAWLGADRLTLLTDTEPLADALAPFFGRPVSVVPIPHTPAPRPSAGRQNPARCVLWWPGQPREDKGWAVIRRIAAQPADALTDGAVLQLVVAKSAGIVQDHSGIAIETVTDVLPPAQYEAWLARADVILLPYDPRRYGAASSGIFTEAVVCGAIPLVSAGTWMSSELAKFGLQALVLDWNRDDLVAQIAALSRDPAVTAGLAVMREHYLAYHCVATYGRVFQWLWDGTAAAVPTTADAH